MAATYPKSSELQAFEDWARDKTWFKKTRGHFGRNCNDTCYTHYTVNDRANAFLAGIKYAGKRATLEQVCDVIRARPDLAPSNRDEKVNEAFAAIDHACEVICAYSPRGESSITAFNLMQAKETFLALLPTPPQPEE